jgi:hypothetical protein
VRGEREEGDFVDAETQTRKNPSNSSNETVAECRRIAFEVIDDRHLKWDFSEAKSDVSESSAQLASRSVIRSGRGLDIRKYRGTHDHGQEGEENWLHLPALRVRCPRSIKEKTAWGAAGKIRLALKERGGMMARMIEVEIYAAGVRQPDKMLGLALELDVIPNLRYKADTNHDVVFMEFGGELPSIESIESIFRKIGLEPRFVGQLPEAGNSGKKTQRIL